MSLKIGLNKFNKIAYPIPSMYGIFTYIWLIFMVNVGKYTVRPMDPMGTQISFFF